MVSSLVKLLIVVTRKCNVAHKTGPFVPDIVKKSNYRVDGVQGRRLCTPPCGSKESAGADGLNGGRTLALGGVQALAPPYSFERLRFGRKARQSWENIKIFQLLQHHRVSGLLISNVKHVKQGQPPIYIRCQLRRPYWFLLTRSTGAV